MFTMVAMVGLLVGHHAVHEDSSVARYALQVLLLLLRKCSLKFHDSNHLFSAHNREVKPAVAYYNVLLLCALTGLAFFAPLGHCYALCGGR